MPVATAKQWFGMYDGTKPKGIALTSTDVELFRWLWMLRVLTLDHLRRLGYYQPDTGRLSSLDNVRKRLRRLDRAGYLDGDRLLETRERIYFLAEPALGALREELGIRQRRLYQLRGMETLRQVHHALMVSECAVRLVESIRGSQLQLFDLPPLGACCYHTHAVGDVRKKRHVERFVTQEDLRVPGHAKPLRVRPDLVFALAQKGVGRLYFLEADRGTESPSEIAKKLLAYHHYAQYPDPRQPSQYLWKRYGDLRDFRVILITNDKRRVASLWRALGDAPGSELTAIAAESAVRERNVVFDGVWTNMRGRGRALARRISPTP